MKYDRIICAGKLISVPTVRCPVSNKLYTDTAKSDPFIPTGLEFNEMEFAAILNDLPDGFFEEDYL
jgi:hypothetical protein